MVSAVWRSFLYVQSSRLRSLAIRAMAPTPTVFVAFVAVSGIPAGAIRFFFFLLSFSVTHQICTTLPALSVYNWSVSFPFVVYFNILHTQVCVLHLSYFEWKVKVNLSLYRPWSVARGWGSHIFRHSAHRWRQGCQPYAPAAFYTQEDSWYSFLWEAESIPGP
jgi:hypothetical protein